MAVNQRGGHRGMLMMAPAAGSALVKITGPRDANCKRGRTKAEAHGMDAAHGFMVATMSTPQITVTRVENIAQSTVWAALEASEQGEGVPFAFYPIGESPYSDTATRVSGTADVSADTNQDLTNSLTSAITLDPAEADWLWEGYWT